MTTYYSRPEGFNKFENNTLDLDKKSAGVLDTVDYQNLSLRFRGLKAGPGIELTLVHADDGIDPGQSILVSAIGSDGSAIIGVEDAAASGTSLIGATPVTGSTINLRTLTAGPGVTLTEAGDVVTISSSLNQPKNGSIWIVGKGSPVGKVDGNNSDMYLDSLNGNIYTIQNSTWNLVANIVGPQGPTGPQGPAGKDGKDGTGSGGTGSAIITGSNAPTADIGNVGDMYIATSTGAVYQKTTSGWGSPVIASIIGPQGPKGDTGATGLTGPAGVQGPKGDTGDVGPQGPAGPKGADGAVGPVGPAGPAGTDGKDGATGATGPQGPKGDKGDAGSGLTNKGSWVSGTTYNPGDYVFAATSEGSSTTSMFIVEASAAFVSSTDPYADTANWVEFTAPQGETGATGPQGPKGDKGDTGATGPAGEVGATGPAGPQGETGATGAAGAAASVTVGTTTSGDTASVTNSGTSSAAVLDFVLVNGKDGAVGATGETGPQGPKGDTGEAGAAATVTVGTVTSGDTAAVTNSGTTSAAVLDFVLVNGKDGAVGATGPQGPAGEAGPKGDKGDTGAKGSQWFTGTTDPVVGTTPPSAVANDMYLNTTSNHVWTFDGTTWFDITDIKGATGETGATGPQGPKGDTGATGETGPQGPKGDAGATGETGPAGKDGTSFTYKGAWTASTNYAVDDVFTEAGTSYIVTVAYESGVEFGATDTTNASVLAAKGADGSSAENAITGVEAASGSVVSATTASGVVTLDVSAGTSGQVLTTSEAGKVAWATPSAPASAYTGMELYAIYVKYNGAVNSGAVKVGIPEGWTITSSVPSDGNPQTKVTLNTGTNTVYAISGFQTTTGEFGTAYTGDVTTSGPNITMAVDSGTTAFNVNGDGWIYLMLYTGPLNNS